MQRVDVGSSLSGESSDWRPSGRGLGEERWMGGGGLATVWWPPVVARGLTSAGKVMLAAVGVRRGAVASRLAAAPEMSEQR